MCVCVPVWLRPSVHISARRDRMQFIVPCFPRLLRRSGSSSSASDEDSSFIIIAVAAVCAPSKVSKSSSHFGPSSASSSSNLMSKVVTEDSENKMAAVSCCFCDATIAMHTADPPWPFRRCRVPPVLIVNSRQSLLLKRLTQAPPT